MNKLTYILILIISLSCVNNKKNLQEAVSQSIKKTEPVKKEKQETVYESIGKIKPIEEGINPASTTQKIKLTGIEKEIGDVALSFHRWYIKNTNEINSEISTDFEVTEGENNSCVIDYEPYFKELRKLGTISNSFMDNEKERTKLCAETISGLKWSEYGEGNPENCDDYLYWTNSQDVTDGVDVVGIHKENDNWTVFLSLFMKDEKGQKYFGSDRLKVIVIKENQIYLIEKIKWIMK
ncbi:hypothetical protein Q4Q35_02140 [Flavivirga aquimarina]|uniref:Lipoprotein n=1 Tax=Flavivirga aquimarina TaxID=2027862 RepID=A0ABT8W661_9FLAO|nr:hypothetical protein [Flavivirga aquimarina]MDO5968596.1 hypothetical protein [Flavivirga aquimarina]